ncbi:glycosyltransferase [Nocardioides nanhaiensis]|uniref:Glycosyl transferase family 1 domain-containing protein n=1 Tax=Nocardioides nanhaiensis TaxID=1476871 RepID=A0ABP8W209_9ACTN
MSLLRVTFLVPTLYDQGGTASAVATQASALVRHPAVAGVHVVSVYRPTDQPHFTLDPQVTTEALVDTRVDDESQPDHPDRITDPAWDPTLDARGDLAVQRHLPALDCDVLVTVTPALLALAVACRPPGAALVHQEHRSSSQRRAGLEPLLSSAPHADLVALLTEPMEHWLRHTLAGRGATVPRTAVVPNAVPPGFRPRSLRDTPLVVAAGRLVGEKQYPQLVEAFGLVADRLPQWRLRIFGEGPGRAEIVRTVRRLGLFDRVELPGSTTDLASEWARASISAMTSRSEGFPLVMQEAMAAGVPVVSYDSPSGPRAIIEDGVDGVLVPQDSPAELAAALLRLATEEDLRHRLGEAARHAAVRFASDAVTERWVALYGGLVRDDLPPVEPALPQDAPPLGVVLPDPAEVDPRAVATAAAQQAGRMAGVELAREHDRLVVAAPDARAWLDALADLPPPALPDWLCLVDPGGRGWPERRGTVPQVAAAVRRGRPPRVRLEPWRPLDPSSREAVTVDLDGPTPSRPRT